MTSVSGGHSENKGNARGGREASYIRRARELERSGDHDLAIESLERAIELAPDKASYYLMLAELHRAKHRIEPAMQAIKRAVELDPTDLACQEAQLQMFIEYGKLDEAIVECKRILKAQPKSMLALDVLGLAYLQQGYFDKALRITTKLIHLNPTDSTNHFKRAVLLQQKGDCARAIEEFSRVIEMEPDGEMSEAAHQAVMVLDGLQLRQITMLAEDDGLFHAKLIRDPEMAIAERGFVLSYAGVMALRQMDFATVLDMEQNRQNYYH